jgi:hypothetical protein
MDIDPALMLSNMLYAAALAMLMLTVLSFLAGWMLGKNKSSQADARYSVSLVSANVTLLLGAMASAAEHMPADPTGALNMPLAFWLIICGIAGVILLMMLFKGDL